MILPSRADYFSTKECRLKLCLKVLLVFLGSSSDHTYKLAAPSHLAQFGLSGRMLKWAIELNGVSRVSKSGVGLVLQSPTGELMEQTIASASQLPTMRQNMKLCWPN
ncbi:hypothetical protein CK203_051813 [Vitis vinifera]|uniref:Uncharacterized protein n=1 Tax=Vitis vinifera TaxID=29760 RepID=A0A438GUR6_VITVI|nr:hypothetical protein CK203_051813 [Vitis vinifera]